MTRNDAKLTITLPRALKEGLSRWAKANHVSDAAAVRLALSRLIKEETK